MRSSVHGSVVGCAGLSGKEPYSVGVCVSTAVTSEELGGIMVITLSQMARNVD